MKTYEGKKNPPNMCFCKHKHWMWRLRCHFYSFLLLFFKRLYKNLNAMELEMKMPAFFPGKSLSNKPLKHSALLQGSLNQIKVKVNSLKLSSWVKMPENLRKQALTTETWFLFCDVKHCSYQPLTPTVSAQFTPSFLHWWLSRGHSLLYQRAWTRDYPRFLLNVSAHLSAFQRVMLPWSEL